MTKAEYERGIMYAKHVAGLGPNAAVALASLSAMANSLLAANKVVEAARSIQQWDMLNPPRPEICADLPWLKRMIDEALRELDQGKA